MCPCLCNKTFGLLLFGVQPAMTLPKAYGCELNFDRSMGKAFESASRLKLFNCVKCVAMYVFRTWQHVKRASPCYFHCNSCCCKLQARGALQAF
jgi:hypothetical protein